MLSASGQGGSLGFGIRPSVENGRGSLPVGPTRHFERGATGGSAARGARRPLSRYEPRPPLQRGALLGKEVVLRVNLRGHAVRRVVQDAADDVDRHAERGELRHRRPPEVVQPPGSGDPARRVKVALDRPGPEPRPGARRVLRPPGADPARQGSGLVYPDVNPAGPGSSG